MVGLPFPDSVILWDLMPSYRQASSLQDTVTAIYMYVCMYICMYVYIHITQHMKKIFFQGKKNNRNRQRCHQFPAFFFSRLTFLNIRVYVTSFTIQKIMTFVSHQQIVGDVRQIFDSNSIERAAGKTKQNALLPVTAHGPTHLQPNIFSCTNVAQFRAGLYAARQCTTA